MSEAEKKNVVAYLRVSTDAQAGEDKFGLDYQMQLINEYCAKHDMVVADTVTDEGKSGAKERPKFEAIIRKEHNPPIAGIIVAKSDRVARDINIYFYYKMLLRKANMDLWSVTEDFGQAGLFAPMLEAFTLCVADMERRNITMRTSGGRQIKAEKGGYSGGKAPFGYKVFGGKLVIVPEEAEIVRYIFQLREEGATLQEISDKCLETGRLTRKGGRFNPGALKHMLDNRRTYEGYYHYKGFDGGDTWVRGQQEPILREVNDNGEVSDN